MMKENLTAIHDAIFDGEETAAKTSTSEALEHQVKPAEILRDAVIPAIKAMGASMEEGEFFMPEIKMSTKALKAVANILRPSVVPKQDVHTYAVPPWTGVGDTDDIGKYLQAKATECGNLSERELMGLLDMIAGGLDTHEFTPCKIQAKEVGGK